MEGHTSEPGIQRCLEQVGRPTVSLGTISGVIREAERRALALVARTAPPTVRAVALDEIYGRARDAAYLHIVDVQSGAVGAAEGLVPLDGETWTLTLWRAQERGLRWHTAASDGGAAMEQALRVVDPEGGLHVLGPLTSSDAGCVPTDWLVALGYPPAAESPPPPAAPCVLRAA